MFGQRLATPRRQAVGPRPRVHRVLPQEIAVGGDVGQRFRTGLTIDEEEENVVLHDSG
mgnify:FL=1